MTQPTQPTPLATLTDLQTVLLRPLTQTETTAAPAFLKRAESLLAARVPELRSSADADADFRTIVIGIEAEMVARVFRNPEGIRREEQGNYSYQVDYVVAAGKLFISDDDLDALGIRRAVGTVAPVMDGYAANRFGGVTDPALRFQYGWPGVSQ